MNGKSGFTLLEITVAMFLLSLAVFFSSSLLIYSAKTANRQAAAYESFENARVGLEFLTEHIRNASAFKFTTYRNTDILQRLDLFTETISGEHVYIFTFDRAGKRLNFGGSIDYPFTVGVNELAYGIESVEIFFDEGAGMLYYAVASADGGFALSGGTDVCRKEAR